MYIIFNKDSKKVVQTLPKEPVAISSTLEIARCESVSKYNEAQGEYLTVTNLQEKTEKYIDKEYVEKEIEINEEDLSNIDFVISANGMAIVKELVEVEKERKYFTCDLIVSFDNKKYKANKIAELKRWFNNEYRYYAEKFTRFLALNIDEMIYDKFFDITYSNINDLYLKAENVRAEINKLETDVQTL